MIKKTNTFSPCIICNADCWLALPAPHPMRSVRSDGTIINCALTKAQCNECGMVQIMNLPDDSALATMYTNQYDIYNKRPASEQFVVSRYSALAKSITSAVFPFQPKNVLEVGCGNGSVLEVVQTIWNQTKCIGIEPVISAVNAAKSRSLPVHQGMIGIDVPSMITNNKYDVIYSVHVIEHTKNPVSFLKDLIKMLAPQGRLIISCPNAYIPNLEIMRSDHNYSMTPYHLEMLAQKAGLKIIKNIPCPGGAENLDCNDNQLLVCEAPENDDQLSENSIPLPDYLSVNNRLILFDKRKAYLSRFSQLDELLLKELNRSIENLYCFGSGGWASMLAGFAPKIWGRIKGCIIDSETDETFHGKPIYSSQHLKQLNPSAIIIGTNPAVQPMIADRLLKKGFDAIRWDHIIAR